MKKALVCDIFPKVVRADHETELTIGLPRAKGAAARTYEVTYSPMEEIVRRSGWPEKNKPTLRVEAGCIKLKQMFDGEQEHVLLLDELAGGSRKRLATFHIYSVKDDLAGLRPWKGDLHMHSTGSDGHEPPAEVVARCRGLGMDFVAVTDHGRYEPSLQAIHAFEGVPVDLKMYPGEEVHPPAGRVHMVNFGGRESLGQMFEKGGDKWMQEVKNLERLLPDFKNSHERYEAASCLWCYRKIRELGGLGVFCHPYWVTNDMYNVPEKLIAWHMDHQPFDAFELLNGSIDRESNILQVVRYNEATRAGKKIPIVASNDTHSCGDWKRCGTCYTIIFAASAGLPDIVAAVKELRSVAVEALPGATPCASGPFRLVKYAQFLMRELMPGHDALCAAESKLMLAHLAGDRAASDKLARAHGGVAAYLAKCFGA